MTVEVTQADLVLLLKSINKVLEAQYAIQKKAAQIEKALETLQDTLLEIEDCATDEEDQPQNKKTKTVHEWAKSDNNNVSTTERPSGLDIDKM